MSLVHHLPCHTLPCHNIPYLHVHLPIPCRYDRRTRAFVLDMMQLAYRFSFRHKFFLPTDCWLLIFGFMCDGDFGREGGAPMAITAGKGASASKSHNYNIASLCSKRRQTNILI